MGEKNQCQCTLEFSEHTCNTPLELKKDAQETYFIHF